MRIRIRALIRAIALLLAPAALAAQTISPPEYAARRDTLAAHLGEGVVVAFGAVSPTEVARQPQLPTFRWLTGALEYDAALLLVLHGGRAAGTLFTRPRDPRRVLYDGFPPDSTALARTTGLAVRSIAALPPMLDSLAAAGLTVYTLRDYAAEDYVDSDTLTRGAVFMRVFAQGHPRTTVRDAHATVDSLRARKSPAELPKNRAMIARVRPAVERYNDIGVRIEDDYAITNTSVEWLSRAPRESAEIEAAMAHRGR